MLRDRLSHKNRGSARNILSGTQKERAIGVFFLDMEWEIPLI
jgi:hypothetical protein